MKTPHATHKVCPLSSRGRNVGFGKRRARKLAKRIAARRERRGAGQGVREEWSERSDQPGPDDSNVFAASAEDWDASRWLRARPILGQCKMGWFRF